MSAERVGFMTFDGLLFLPPTLGLPTIRVRTAQRWINYPDQRPLRPVPVKHSRVKR